MTPPFSRFRLRYTYPNPLDQQRAIGLLAMDTAGLLLALLFFVSALLNQFNVVQLLPSDANGTFVIVGLLSVVAFFAVGIFVQMGRLGIASVLFVAILTVATLPFVLSPGLTMMTVILPIIAAGVLLGRRGLLVVVLLVAAVLFFRLNAQSELTQVVRQVPADTVFLDLLANGIPLLLGAIFLYAFSGNASTVTQVTVEDARHLRAVSGFTASLTPSASENDGIATALRLLQTELGYSLAQVYLLAADGSLVRRLRLALNQTELTTSTTINANDTQLLADLVRTRETIVVTTTDARAGHLIAPAHRAAAVPIVYGGVLYGVLDAQTPQEFTLTAGRIAAVEQLGEQLATLLAGTRLTDDLRRTVREQEGALSSARQQLSEVQGRSRIASTVGWNSYFRGRSLDAQLTPGVFGYDLTEGGGSAAIRAGNIVAATTLPPDIQVALRRGDVHVEQHGDEQVLTAPITFRDQTLGALAFTLPADIPVSDRQLDIVRTVTNRLAAALENNRLFEQTQAQAQRERKAADVSAVLLGATDIEQLLELAANQFNDALGAVYTRVVVQPAEIEAAGRSLERASDGGIPAPLPVNGTAANGMSARNGTNGYHAETAQNGAGEGR